MTITADNIRKIRIAYHLTQDELGSLCDVTAGMINKIERGKYPLTDKIKSALMRELEITPEKLAILIAEYERMMTVKRFAAGIDSDKVRELKPTDRKQVPAGPDYRKSILG